MKNSTIGVLILNIGTPADTRVKTIRRYLRRFLMDWRVLDMAAPLRWFLGGFLIPLFRARRSAHAYRSVWTQQGSPLGLHTRSFAHSLQSVLGNNYSVRYGLAFGTSPSIEACLESFKNEKVSQLIILPIYPHYASATVGSMMEIVFKQISQNRWIPSISVIPPFFDQDFFINAWVKKLKQNPPHDYTIFSFHGLPLKQLRDIGDGVCAPSHSGENTCCDNPQSLQFCYRAQCVHSAKKIAQNLGLEESQWEIAFQSRLGRATWTGPETAKRLPQLVQLAVKHVRVVPLSFCIDCVETLEEIGIQHRDIFTDAGGKNLTLISSLNSDPEWVEGVGHAIRKASH